MSSRWLILLIIALFLGTLLARLPARWVVVALPEGSSCLQPQGTLWNGSCGQLQMAQVQLAPVSWQLQPSGLLRGALAARLHSGDPRLSADVRAAAYFNRDIELRDLRLTMPLERRVWSQLPANWRGTVQVDLPLIRLRGLQLQSLRGTVQAHGLQQLQPPLPFGNFELRFADTGQGDTLRGELRDLGGPLAVSGELQFQRGSRAYELNALVATRADADPGLANVVEQLGPADGNGRRAFSIAGTW